MTHAQIAARYAVHIPAFDRHEAATNSRYWEEHADEDPEATEARLFETACAQIKEISRGS